MTDLEHQVLLGEDDLGHPETSPCACSIGHDHDDLETPEEDECHCGSILDDAGRCWYCDRPGRT